MPALKERVFTRSLMYISPLLLANTARFQSISHTWTNEITRVNSLAKCRSLLCGLNPQID